MFCSRCGRAIANDARFCMHCGAPVFSGPPQPAVVYAAPQPYSPPRPKKRSGCGIAAALLIGVPCLLLVVTFAVLLLTGSISLGGGVLPAGASTAATGYPAQARQLPSPGGPGLKLGPAEVVAQQSVPAGGGTVTVSQSGSALNGMTITVPQGCYPAPVDFTVSEAAVQSSAFPGGFKILSPLIKVDNGGGFSDWMMQVKVPCKLPDGDIPLGFYYDEKTGALESLPVLSADENSVTVGVRHFSGVVVGGAPKDSASDCDTHFRPGLDDFHMTNLGSSLCPRGYCGGDSLSEIWYYTYKTLKGEKELWDKYDNYGRDASVAFKTRDFQSDDTMALRLVSEVQNQATWSSDLTSQFWKACKASPEQTFYGILYAMELTKMPQLIDISALDGNGNATSEHAIVAYRAQGKKIYVADPNYPGKQDRFIEFSGNNFLPYSSAATRDDADKGNGTQYTQFVLLGFTAMFDPVKIGQLWQQAEDRTLGDADFPDVATTLYTKVKAPDGSEKEEEITDGYEASSSTLTITRVSDLASPYTRHLYVVDSRGQVSEIQLNPDGTYSVKLAKGDNYIGIGINKDDGKSPARWHDFKWLRVVLGFPFAGKWEGTVHFDKVNIEFNPDAVSPTGDAQGCDQLDADLIKQLKAMEGHDMCMVMIAEPTGEKEKYKLKCGVGATMADAEAAVSDKYSIVVTVTDNTVTYSLKQDEAGMELNLTTDGNDVDTLTGAVSYYSLKEPSQGIFTTVHLKRMN